MASLGAKAGFRAFKRLFLKAGQRQPGGYRKQPASEGYMRKTILFLVGRDNGHKNDFMNQILLQALAGRNLRIMWEDPAGNWIHNWGRMENKIRWMPGFIRKRNLKRSILGLAAGNEIIVLAYSSGARASSLIADSMGIKRIICLGYPFKNPKARFEEAERYSHLAGLKTPMLIIQGDKDAYGGLEIRDKYAFGPRIELFFVDANHDFDAVRSEEWERVTAKIKDVIHPHP